MRRLPPGGRPKAPSPPSASKLFVATAPSVHRPSHVILHAVQGWGKTSLAAMAEKPIFLMTKNETGLLTLVQEGQLPPTPWLRLPRGSGAFSEEAETWLEALSAIKALLTEEHPYQTLCLDTMNGLERLCHEYVCANSYEGDWGEKGFVGFQRGYRNGSIPLHHLSATLADMPYTMNPHLPKLRMDAARLVLRDGWSTRAVARHTGFNQSTIARWVQEAKITNRNTIPTKSSRPHHHPHALPDALVQGIVRYRFQYRRGAEFLHHFLKRDGYQMSLSSVKRTLKRQGLTYPSRWKKWHQYPPRPLPHAPGVLVELDTIHDGPHTDRLYVYTLLDVCSRWTYAVPVLRITTHASVRFVENARRSAPFSFQTLQSDHGSEFSKWFSKRIGERGMAHRHSRVRQPNDNAHLERFNRTLQEECLSRIPRTLGAWKREIPQYLHWYNAERPHLGLQMRTPLEVMRSY